MTNPMTATAHAQCPARVDRIVTFVRGHRVMPPFCRTLPAWRSQLETLGFEVRSRPMSQGTPFANVLPVARVKESA